MSKHALSKYERVYLYTKKFYLAAVQCMKLYSFEYIRVNSVEYRALTAN